MSDPGHEWIKFTDTATEHFLPDTVIENDDDDDELFLWNGLPMKHREQGMNQGINGERTRFKKHFQKWESSEKEGDFLKKE